MTTARVDISRTSPVARCPLKITGDHAVCTNITALKLGLLVVVPEEEARLGSTLLGQARAPLGPTYAGSRRGPRTFIPVTQEVSRSDDTVCGAAVTSAV